jgi:predicted amidohydrolase
MTSNSPAGGKFRAAAVQMRSGLSVAANVAEATRLIREAAAAGAAYVLTPEMTTVLDRDRARLLAAIESEDRDPSLPAFRALARELGIHLHIGSMAIRLPATGRAGVANRAFLIGPDGGILARYDKIHMFDVDLPNGETYRESALYQAGSAAAVVDLPWARVGLTVCYDVRFPLLYRQLAQAGAVLIAIPAAFTKTTGEAHWHVLVRARAIETGSYVVAAAQGGRHEDGRDTYGHSLIVDPWGGILAEAATAPGIIVAEIDPAASAAARHRIPALFADRSFSPPSPPAARRPRLKTVAP